MMIVCANSKGGVGKSTIATHLAVWLHDFGFKTALLDADKQRSSSQWVAEAEPEITVRVASTPEECLSAVQELAQSHDFVIGDAPGGLEDLSRTLLILADIAIFPISPSLLDIRSVVDATEVLRFAQGINGGRPEGRLVLNKMKSRTLLSQELRQEAPRLGIPVATKTIRDLQVYCDAIQQGTVVTRMRSKGRGAAAEINALFNELFGDYVTQLINERRTIANNG